MITPPTFGGRALVAPAKIPEPGAWHSTRPLGGERIPGDAALWLRVPGDDETVDAARLAADRLRHLDHPAIPRAVQVDAVHGALVVAAPRGIPLARLLDHRREEAFRLTPATVLDVGAQLADVVVHAHERGRPHGHLSPDLVWLTPEGRLVVWGFASGPDAVSSLRWWAPERARGRRASGDADQWAVAAILASLVTGRLPWRGEDPITEARVGDVMHLSQPVLEQWKPLGRLFQRALSSEARDRFPSVHPVRQAIDAMRQRVPHASDLPRLGALLWAAYGDPEALGVDDAPSPSALRAAPVAVPDLEDAPTTISDAEPPLDATEDGFASPTFGGANFQHELPTDVATSPTRVPLPSIEAMHSDEENHESAPQPVVPPVLPAPLDLSSVSPADDVPSLDDVAIAVIEGADDPLPEPPVWWERFDIRGVAPWVVGTMIALLAVYLGWSLS